MRTIRGHIRWTWSHWGPRHWWLMLTNKYYRAARRIDLSFLDEEPVKTFTLTICGEAEAKMEHLRLQSKSRDLTDLFQRAMATYHLLIFSTGEVIIREEGDHEITVDLGGPITKPFLKIVEKTPPTN